MLMAIANPLNSSELIYPALEVFHIGGFILLIGSIAVSDFRLLGLGIQGEAPSEIASALNRWTWIGLLSVMLSGLMMYSTDLDLYENHSFQIKIVLLTAALIFHYTIHRKIVNSTSEPAMGKLVALISLVLWTGVIAGGTFIAFL